jgi:hypothetical protein
MSDKGGIIGTISILLAFQFSIPFPSPRSEKIFYPVAVRAIGVG